MSSSGGGAAGSEGTLSCSLDRKKFLALLVAVASSTVLGNDDDGTIAELMQGENRSGFANELSQLLSRAVKSAWTAGRLQEKLKSTAMSPEHADIVVGYFQRERAAFMAAVQRQSVLTNNRLHKLTWRADIKSRVSSKSPGELSTPIDEAVAATAIFQLETTSSSGKGDTNVVRFEMDREQLADAGAADEHKERLAARS